MINFKIKLIKHQLYNKIFRQEYFHDNKMSNYYVKKKKKLHHLFRFLFMYNMMLFSTDIV